MFDDLDPEAKVTKVVLDPRREFDFRFKCLVLGVLLPLIAWCVNGFRTSPYFSPAETRENWLLSPPVVLCFTPFVFYSIVTLAAWCLQPDLQRKAWIRCGILLGMGLAFQYLVIFLLYFRAWMVGVTVACILLETLWRLISALFDWKSWKYGIMNFFIDVVRIAFLVATAKWMPLEQLAKLVAISCLLAPLMAAPLLAMIMYLRAALRIDGDVPYFSKQQLIENRKPYIALIAAYSASWVLAFDVSRFW